MCLLWENLQICTFNNVTVNGRSFYQEIEDCVFVREQLEDFKVVYKIG